MRGTIGGFTSLGLGMVALGGIIMLEPAQAEPNGRPPPIKLGTPSPSPTPAPAPIKIGKPSPKPASGPLSGVDFDKMIDAALKLPLDPVDFTWTSGDKPIYMGPADSMICVLTRVSGNFAGGAEHVLIDLKKLPNGQVMWRLSGTSAAGHIQAGAACVKKDRFTTAMVGNEKIFPAPLPTKSYGGCDEHRFKSELDGPNVAHFLGEVAGKFRGGGDSVKVGGSSVYVYGCSGYAAGSAIAVQMNGSGPVKYIGPKGKTASFAAATFEGWSNKYDNWEKVQPAETWVEGAKWLPAVDGSLCGLTAIAGNLGDHNHLVAIVREKHPDGHTYWKLNVANSSVGIVRARVRCLARDQR